MSRREGNRSTFARYACIAILLAGLMVSFTAYSWGQTSDQIGITTGVYITAFIINGVVRIAAIAAGIYIVWLGHDTLIRGVQGDFEFEGRFGRLKGSMPGLLFVLLGSLAIGWALATKYTATEQLSMGAGNQTNPAGSSISPPIPSLPPKPK